jgi:hypothetical protein
MHLKSLKSLMKEQSNLGKDEVLESFYVELINKNDPLYNEDFHEMVLKMFDSGEIKEGSLEFKILGPYVGYGEKEADQEPALTEEEQFFKAMEVGDVERMNEILTITQNQELKIQFSEFLKKLMPSKEVSAKQKPSQLTTQKYGDSRVESMGRQYAPIQRVPIQRIPIPQQLHRLVEEFNKTRAEEKRLYQIRESYQKEFDSKMQSMESEKTKLMHAWKESNGRDLERAWRDSSADFEKSKQGGVFNTIWQQQSLEEQAFQNAMRDVETNLAQIQTFEQQFLNQNKELLDFYHIDEYSGELIENGVGYSRGDPIYSMPGQTVQPAVEQRYETRLQPAVAQPRVVQVGRGAERTQQVRLGARAQQRFERQFN